MSDNDTREDLLAARAYLLRVAEPPASALWRFVADQGPIRAAELVRAGKVPVAVAKETDARRALDPHQDLRAATDCGARLLVPEDPDWPQWPLLVLEQRARWYRDMTPPLALWCKGPGDLDRLAVRAASIVGARAATGYGEQVATELGYDLADRGWTVISGAASGIDGAAHRGALSARGDTVAVLACGLDQDYPSSHAALLRQITATGLVISEYAPGVRPAKHRFLVRNRLIAALGGGTVVVEAGVRSGAANTAGTAHRLDRPVMAVPGPITSAMSLGCNTMLRAGYATAVSSCGEVIETIGGYVTDQERPDSPSRPTDGLDRRELSVHQALDRIQPRSMAKLAVESGIPLSSVRAILPSLELCGLARRTEEGWCAPN
ncbi:DNA-protecting protein DprA [Pseudonocardiaceae bacterium YIM PH 21723]|nr:DNA-protecting protein DprA [Pseudonocardiaceae bacterium YIM PH 21723]